MDSDTLDKLPQPIGDSPAQNGLNVESAIEIVEDLMIEYFPNISVHSYIAFRRDLKVQLDRELNNATDN